MGGGGSGECREVGAEGQVWGGVALDTIAYTSREGWVGVKSEMKSVGQVREEPSFAGGQGIAPFGVWRIEVARDDQGVPFGCKEGLAEKVFKGYVFGFGGAVYVEDMDGMGSSLGEKEGGEEVRDGGRESGVLCCEVALHKGSDLGEFRGSRWRSL